MARSCGGANVRSDGDVLGEQRNDGRNNVELTYVKALDSYFKKFV